MKSMKAASKMAISAANGNQHQRSGNNGSAYQLSHRHGGNIIKAASK
jgi:hypothetical protein